MKKFIVLILIIITLGAPAASAGLLQDIQGYLKGLAITSYSSSVPVSIDYSAPSSYWIISANVGSRTDDLNIVLPQDTQLTLDTNTAIKSGQDVTLRLKPGQPYSTTSLVSGTDIRYVSYGGLGNSYTSAPYYDVQGAMWLTKSTYSVQLVESQGGVQASSDIEVSYLDKQTIYLKDSRGYQATLENVGTLGNGASPPSGSLVVVKDPQGNRHLYDKVSFQLAVQRANDDIGPWALGSVSWSDIWAKMITYGLPAEIQTPGPISYPTDTSIMVTYPTGSFSAQVVLYVPQEMANSITINLHASKPQIVEKTLTDATMGEYAILTVKVDNIGTDDYIAVKPTSQYYAFTAMSDSRQYVKAGDTNTFTWRAQALPVTSDISTAINILAEGTAGTDSTMAYGKIFYKPDVVYCDPVNKIITGCGNAKTTWKLQVTAYTPDGQTVLSSGPIYVNGELKGNGIWSGDVPKGDYIITGVNTSQYYPPTPIKVTITDQDRSASLVYSKIPKCQDCGSSFDWGNLFWLGILIGIIAIIWYTKIWTYILPYLKLVSNPIVLFANPVMLVLIVAVLIIVLVLLWRIYSLLSSIGSGLTSLIGW